MKLRFFKHKSTRHLTVIVIVFLISGFFLSINGNGIDLGSKEGIKLGFKIYISWLGNSIDNIQGITSNAIKMDWSGNNTSLE